MLRPYSRQNHRQPSLSPQQTRQTRGEKHNHRTPGTSTIFQEPRLFFTDKAYKMHENRSSTEDQTRHRPLRAHGKTRKKNNARGPQRAPSPALPARLRGPPDRLRFEREKSRRWKWVARAAAAATGTRSASHTTLSFTRSPSLLFTLFFPSLPRRFRSAPPHRRKVTVASGERNASEFFAH